MMSFGRYPGEPGASAPGFSLSSQKPGADAHRLATNGKRGDVSPPVFVQVHDRRTGSPVFLWMRRLKVVARQLPKQGKGEPGASAPGFSFAFPEPGG